MASPRTAAVLVLVAAGATASAQQPGPSSAPPTFRSEINYVELPVRVLDGKGNFVGDLKQPDFQIFEDGKLQAISTFSVVDIPIVAPDSTVPDAPIAALEAVASNEPDHFDGRVYLFVLDDYHVPPGFGPKLKELMRRFIREHMSANDVAGVVLTSGRNQDFTRNRRLLLDTVDYFIGEPEPVSAPAVTDFAPLGAFQAYSVLKTIADMADWMASIKGRHKALVYFSSTVGCNLTQGPTTGMCNEAIWDAVHAAQRADVSIYALDPQGLQGPSYARAEVSGRDGPSRGLARAAFAEGRGNGAFNGMRVLAEETGGFAAIDTNNFPAAIDRIVHENSAYYLIGYYSTNAAEDGRFRKNDVKVSRKGARTLFRTGYTASRPARAGAAAQPASATAQLSSLMRSPLPVGGMRLRVSAVPFLGAAGKSNVTVVVETPGDGLKFMEAGGVYSNQIHLSIGLYDRSGKSKATDLPNIELHLQPDRHERAVAEGVRLVSQLEVAPGTYRLWVGAVQTSGDVRGSAMTELVVPDFRKEPLALSGLVVSSSTAEGIQTARGDVRLTAALGGPPSAQRDYSASDTVVIFTEIYDNRSDRSEVTTSVTVKTADGKVVYRAPLEASSAQFGYLARIPLKDLAGGSYLATVEAQSGLPKPISVSRTLQFRVR